MHPFALTLSLSLASIYLCSADLSNNKPLGIALSCLLVSPLAVCPMLSIYLYIYVFVLIPFLCLSLFVGSLCIVHMALTIYCGLIPILSAILSLSPSLCVSLSLRPLEAGKGRGHILDGFLSCLIFSQRVGSALSLPPLPPFCYHRQQRHGDSPHWHLRSTLLVPLSLSVIISHETTPHIAYQTAAAAAAAAGECLCHSLTAVAQRPAAADTFAAAGATHRCCCCFYCYATVAAAAM